MAEAARIKAMFWDRGYALATDGAWVWWREEAGKTHLPIREGMESYIRAYTSELIRILAGDHR
jgi:hypothetical protein